MPDSVTNIGMFAFGGCRRLTTITVGDRVTTVPNWAFYDCARLTRVARPNSITRIEGRRQRYVLTLAGAFAGRADLAEVSFEGNAPRIDYGPAFEGADQATLYYLPGTTRVGGRHGTVARRRW